jgi:hypothetical protein
MPRTPRTAGRADVPTVATHTKNAVTLPNKTYACLWRPGTVSEMLDHVSFVSQKDAKASSALKTIPLP